MCPTNFSVTVKGVQGHAGGSPMSERKDAFMAAELALVLEDAAKKTTSEYITAAVGTDVLAETLFELSNKS